MLTYKLLEINGDEYVYAYYPDGNEDAPGQVALSRNGDKRVLEESARDFGKRYAYHALSGIDLSKNSGTVAWY